MKPRIRQRLEQLADRLDELDALLGSEEGSRDMDQFRRLNKERADIAEVVELFAAYRRAEADLAEAAKMESDPDLRDFAREEMQTARDTLAQLEGDLQRALLPRDPDDDKNIFLEIRAGTGGDESALFAGDLFRMYARFAERNRWKVEIVSKNESDLGGYREIIARIEGPAAYAKLKFESGGHRVQRVPETESQGRVHTSACTVAIMPEVDSVDEIDINPADLRIDTYRASGAGGQHVNRTDSAIRITHIPTGVVVECQDERSQHKNRARAMSVLQARLLAAEQEKHQAEQSESRRLQVGSGDRSERIRTYNFPQGRLTDHRINLTLYKLDDIMEGGLEQVIQPLIHEHQAELLTQLGNA